MWALWQKRDKARLADIGGFRTGEGTGPGANETKELTTLDTPVWMGFMNEDVSVKSVMDTVNGDSEGVLCYVYEDSPSLKGRNL
jgi:tyrosinase